MSRRVSPEGLSRRELAHNQVSGVHEATTRPAPQLEEPLVEVGPLLGSIPMDALFIEFQPIVDLHSGHTRAHEARLSCSAESLTDPHDLFARSAFEKTVGELGRAMRVLAFEQTERARHASCVYMPLHPGELTDGLIVRPDDPLFEHEGLVRLQLSQAAFSSVALHVLTELRTRSDVGLVLDDFGAGPSTLQHLAELQPAAVKLDAALVAGLAQSPRKQAIVCALARLCDELRVELIAKGVEAPGDVEAVLDCGIRLAQGEHVAARSRKPRPAPWPPR